MNALDDAIHDRFEIEFTYDGQPRIVQPAAHGLHKDTGKESLRGYQIGGRSNSRNPPLWDMFTVSKISDLVITDRKFPDDPRFYSRGDKHLRVIYAEL